jgi:hypothetical protein
MRQYLPTTLLIASNLLVSTIGCTKKEDTPPTPALLSATGSYKLDNRTITCQTVAGGGYAYGSGHTGLDYDFINVTLTTTPVPADGAEILQLNYSRPRAGAAYQLYTLTYYTKGSLTPVGDFSGITGTVTPKSRGGFTGTFTGQARSYGSAPSPYKAITDGMFDY